MRFISQNTVADVVIMGNLHIVEKYDVFQLRRVADDAVITDKRAAANKGAVSYLGIFSDNTRSADISRRKNFRSFVHPYTGRNCRIIAFIELSAKAQMKSLIPPSASHGYANFLSIPQPAYG